MPLCSVHPRFLATVFTLTPNCLGVKPLLVWIYAWFTILLSYKSTLSLPKYLPISITKIAAKDKSIAYGRVASPFNLLDSNTDKIFPETANIDIHL